MICCGCGSDSENVLVPVLDTDNIYCQNQLIFRKLASFLVFWLFKITIHVESGTTESVVYSGSAEAKSYGSSGSGTNRYVKHAAIKPRNHLDVLVKSGKVKTYTRPYSEHQVMNCRLVGTTHSYIIFISYSWCRNKKNLILRGQVEHGT